MSIVRVLGLAALSVLVSVQSGLAQSVDSPSFPTKWGLGLVEPVTPSAQMIYDFHNWLLLMCVVISAIVLGLIIYIGIRFNKKANPVPSKTSHNVLLEVVWTVIPVLILVAIAFPSYRVLYFTDKVADPEMTLKITGNQWFWSYEYSDYDIEFDSLPLSEDEIAEMYPGGHRLLETDTRVVLPVDTDIQLLMTSNDVLHNWAMPAFAIKMDTVPGRINETWIRIEKEGVFYGQCSELCGINHYFMPIVVEAVSKEEFDRWKDAQIAGVDYQPTINVAQADVE